MNKKNICLLFISFMCFSSTHTLSSNKKKFVNENITFAEKQIGNELKIINDNGKFINPVTINKKGNINYCNFQDWRSGFFAGNIWYLYELTNKTEYKRLAENFTLELEQAKTLTSHHDIGFIINSSFGNGYRLTNNSNYKNVIIQSARSLSTRFRKNVRVIQSWDVNSGWQVHKGWKCPVIIDNMMNLELLFKATELSGDSTFFKIAVSHADRTLKEQFRKDGSCYHVIDYDPITGEVLHRQTAQGFSDESTWSRGQAWAIYGYAMCYEKTGYKRYLEQALKTFNFMIKHKSMPKDLIPYWDMDAPKIPNEFRDVSSASCIAAALYKIYSFKIPKALKYKKYADKILQSLSSSEYRAQLGSNGNFILKHSVGSIPHNSEIDVPLVYADYYFLEALLQKKKIDNITYCY